MKRTLQQTKRKLKPTENIKNELRRNGKKQALSSRRLNRTTFCTSREMDFFSEKELVTQTGHEIREWPLVLLKELIDNALDACEETDVAPVIDVMADATGITVKDNGPGLPEKTLEGAMDFTIRASNREAYVAPDRGAQGNALKTILPMPVVIDPQHGKLIIEAHGKRHIITCGADPISQRAAVHDDVTDSENVKKRSSCSDDKARFFIGTEVRIEWSPREDCDGDIVWPFNDLLPVYDGGFAERFRSIVEGFSIFNPHATISLDWFGNKTTWSATDTAWQKWKPHQPTSSHWYEAAHLERLIGAYITHDRDAGTGRFVSDFIAEFDGLTGSGKRSKVLDEAGLKRVKLSEFVVGDRLDSDRIAKLLATMQELARPVKPRRLGVIGEEHFRARLLAMGVQENSFSYSKKLSRDGLPFVLESAFGWLGDESKDSRRIFSGANWRAAIKNPFRTFGSTGEGLEATLSDMRAGRNEPIVFVLHLAHPRVEYTDRGKSALVIGGAE